MYLTVKRVLDILFSIVLIVLLLPLLILTAILIYLLMGFPVFFCQYRTGKNSREFKIYKFRTMRKEVPDYKTDKQRITWIGRFLRLFRIDELPQFFNILFGDMSFIGPRPLLPKYLPYYTKAELRRHNIRPGLSGYSQVSNLNYPKWEDQFENDLFYVDNMSFKLDVIILAKTISKLIKTSRMMATGISGGRSNFDTYRIMQDTESNKTIDTFDNIENLSANP